MSSSAFEDVLRRAWARGVAAGDAPTLCDALRVDTADARACEVRAFATLAVLLDDDDLGQIPEGDVVASDAEAAARVLGHAAAAWAAAALHDADAAIAALDLMQVALGEVQAVEPADPRLGAAEAWSDLVVARCAALGGDRPAAERRLRAILRRGDAPPALRVAARLTLGLRVLSAFDRPAEAVAVLERAALDAEGLDEVAEVARARTFAGMYLLVLGNLPRACATLAHVLRDERPAVPARFRLFARMLLAGTRGDDGGLAELASGIERAAADGDHLSYVVFVITSARLHRKRACPADAVMLLSGAIAQLFAADATGQLAAPLVSERDAMREALGSAAYEAACQEAVERLQVAHPR